MVTLSTRPYCHVSTCRHFNEFLGAEIETSTLLVPSTGIGHVPEPLHLRSNSPAIYLNVILPTSTLAVSVVASVLVLTVTE
jgi:hypothetical protein